MNFATAKLQEELNRVPFAGEVIESVERWKVRRNPPIAHADIGRAVVGLATQGWVTILADETIEPFLEELDSY